MKKLIASSATLATFALSLNAFAQDPKGLATVEQATSGSTNVATTGFQTAQTPPDEANDFTRLSLLGGGLIAMGNTQLQQYTLAGDFGLRRGDNQLGVKASLNEASASLQRNEVGELPPMQQTASNYQGTVRYDRFFSELVSGFVQASALNDIFQGLDLRLNIDPGLAVYVINKPDHQWSIDVGYDLQYENYVEEAGRVKESLTLHNARLATAYVNALNESVTFKTGAEYLIALSPFEQCYYTTDTLRSVRCADYQDIDGEKQEEVRRANWSMVAYAKIDAKVSDKFTVITALELRHDNSPVELNYAMNDLRSSISLTYQVF